MSAHFHIPKVWPMPGLSAPGLQQYCPGPRHRQTVRAAAVSARSRRATTRPAPPRPGTPAPHRDTDGGQTADTERRRYSYLALDMVISNHLQCLSRCVQISALCAEFPAVTWGGGAAGAAGAGRRLQVKPELNVDIMLTRCCGAGRPGGLPPTPRHPCRWRVDTDTGRGGAGLQPRQ